MISCVYFYLSLWFISQKTKQKQFFLFFFFLLENTVETTVGFFTVRFLLVLGKNKQRFVLLILVLICFIVSLFYLSENK